MHTTASHIQTFITAIKMLIGQEQERHPLESQLRFHLPQEQIDKKGLGLGPQKPCHSGDGGLDVQYGGHMYTHG